MCSKSCGHGTKTRYRCTAEGGENVDRENGQSTERQTVACKEKSCAVNGGQI